MIPMIAPAVPLLRIVVLSAGSSARLGKPKPFATVRGVSLLERTLRLLAPFRSGTRIIVVAPPRTPRFRHGVAARAATIVVNRRRVDGLSSSVRLGIRAARWSAAVLILPVDLVDLTDVDVARLMRRFSGFRRRVAARRTAAGAAAPLILPRWLYARAARITGDQGLRELVRDLPAHQLGLVDMPSAAADVDTPGELATARRRTRRAGR